jgi:hypothetical protein
MVIWSKNSDQAFNERSKFGAWNVAVWDVDPTRKETGGVETDRRKKAEFHMSIEIQKECRSWVEKWSKGGLLTTVLKVIRVLKVGEESEEREESEKREFSGWGAVTASNLGDDQYIGSYLKFSMYTNATGTNFEATGSSICPRR